MWWKQAQRQGEGRATLRITLMCIAQGQISSNQICNFLRATTGSNASFPPEWLQLQLSKFDLPYLTLDVANLRLTLVRPALRNPSLAAPSA
jgi:hypothetical protein